MVYVNGISVMKLEGVCIVVCFVVVTSSYSDRFTLDGLMGRKCSDDDGCQEGSTKQPIIEQFKHEVTMVRQHSKTRLTTDQDQAKFKRKETRETYKHKIAMARHHGDTDNATYTDGAINADGASHADASTSAKETESSASSSDSQVTDNTKPSTTDVEGGTGDTYGTFDKETESSASSSDSQVTDNTKPSTTDVEGGSGDTYGTSDKETDTSASSSDSQVTYNTKPSVKLMGSGRYVKDEDFIKAIWPKSGVDAAFKYKNLTEILDQWTRESEGKDAKYGNEDKDAKYGNEDEDAKYGNEDLIWTSIENEKSKGNHDDHHWTTHLKYAQSANPPGSVDHERDHNLSDSVDHERGLNPSGSVDHERGLNPTESVDHGRDHYQRKPPIIHGTQRPQDTIWQTERGKSPYRYAKISY